MSEPYVLGIGAANIDVHGKSRVPIVMRDSNPGHLRTSAGGVTRNVLENLARLGVLSVSSELTINPAMSVENVRSLLEENGR